MTDGFADLAWCKGYVLDKIPELGGEEPRDLGVKLEALKGTLPAGGPMYRPDLYISRWLDANKGLLKAKGGTEFRIAERVAAYLKNQADLDSAYSLTVPPGTEASVPKTQMWPYSGSVNTVVRF